MPSVEVAKVTAPVDALIDSPAVEEYVPPVVPLNVTEAVPPSEQYGDPA